MSAHAPAETRLPRALPRAFPRKPRRRVLTQARGLLAALLIGVGVSASAAAATDAPELDHLLDLIEHRAALMPDVARWKWHRDLPVSDPQREGEVLARSTADAVRAGLEPAGARGFVAAQMAVARDIQQRLHDQWRQQAPAPGGPDLLTDLRPAISATTSAILELLPRVLPLLPERHDLLARELEARLVPRGARPASARDLAAALTALRPGPVARDALERILASGTLRVGTTGDYAPFSALDAAGERTGIDIDLARALADSLGVTPQFVETSWPTLLEDLEARRFDIAMSGISRAPFRARTGDFSAAYHVGGKTPIIRCADRARFDTLAAIDVAGVRAVVNPGGTNERFTRATLDRASIRVFADNTRIFEEIATGRADVMFTDAIEVRLQTVLDPRLCAALPGRTLTYSEKGFLLPREASGAFLRYVDLWLAGVRGDGRLDAIFDLHLRAPADPDRPRHPAHAAPAPR